MRIRWLLILLQKTMPKQVKGPTRKDLTTEIVDELIARTTGRSRVVVEHILENGFITTLDLSKLGYEHPPRAAADVRDRGIPLETVRKTIDGKQVGHYRFPDDLSQLDQSSIGRIAISKNFRNEVLDYYGEIDIFTRTAMSPREIQIDHRIPYRISGDPIQPFHVTDFMPVSAAMNRAKSWECEACPNWEERVAEICSSCYWAIPDRLYEHVATVPVRRLDIIWQGKKEVTEFNHLVQTSVEEGVELSVLIKRMIIQGLEELGN